MPPSKKALDELYREHPSGFVAGRNRLAKQAREAGDPAEADRLAKLRKPNAAAGLLNAAALRDRAALRRFAQATEIAPTQVSGESGSVVSFDPAWRPR